jgi:hypothetical protein
MPLHLLEIGVVYGSQPMLLENKRLFLSCSRTGTWGWLGTGGQASLSRLERAEEAPLRLLFHLIARLIPTNLVACRHDERERGHQRQWRLSRVSGCPGKLHEVARFPGGDHFFPSNPRKNGESPSFLSMSSGSRDARSRVDPPTRPRILLTAAPAAS